MAIKRDLLLVGGGRLIAAVIALVSIRAVTTLLQPEQYGELVLLIAVQTFCGLFLINPVGQHINLHTHAWWEDGTLFGRLLSYRRYILLVSTIGAVGALFIGDPINSRTLVFKFISIFLIVAAGTWNATLIPLLNMLGYRAQSSVLAIATALISLAASVTFVLWFPSVLAWLFGQAIGLWLGALGARFYIRKNLYLELFVQRPLKLMTKKTLMSYCLPLALATGLMWLQLSGYRFLVEHYWGLAQLGLFAVGLQLANQIWALAESLATQFLYPLFYKRVSQHENEAEVQIAISDLMNTLIPTYLLLSGLTILAAPYLLTLLVAPQFASAVNFLVIGVVIELCRVLTNVISNTAHVKRNTSSLALPYAIGAIVVFSGIYIAGMQGLQLFWAGIALAVGGGALLISMAKIMFRQVRFELDAKRCCVSMATLSAMLFTAFYMPIMVGFFSIIAMLLVMAVLTSVVLLAIMWKSPAAKRLLVVQLRTFE